MKKTLVLLLAVALMISMTGMAYAGNDWFAKWKSGASVGGNIMKKIVFENDVKAETGDADAAANTARTMVCGSSEAKADNGGQALSDSTKVITNDGAAGAWSANANAANQANNGVEANINEQASANSDTKVLVDATLCCDKRSDSVGTLSQMPNNRDGGNIADVVACCPASVDGNICATVCVENEVEAETGDASAVGNSADNMVMSNDKAIAVDGATAHNTNAIGISNDGTATAYSGVATATNNANNYVTIDIFRSATSNKKIDVFVEFLAN